MKNFAIIAVLLIRCWIGVFLKIFDRVRNRSKAVHLANMLLYSLGTQSVAHGRTSLDNLQARASCLDVVSHIHNDAAGLNVHMR